jgi:hypothetical protein
LHLIVDCKDVAPDELPSGRVRSQFKAAFDSSRNLAVHFVNCGRILEMLMMITADLSHFRHTNKVLTVGQGPQEASIEELREDPGVLHRWLLHALQGAVRKCFERFPERRTLRSTPITANGYFDARHLTGCPLVFPWLAACMADCLIDTVNCLQSQSSGNCWVDGLRLLACTRNGTVIASALRRLLPDRYPLDVVDRFGPIQRLVEAYDAGTNIYDGSEQAAKTPWYFYIGDFIIAGTEVNVADAHSRYRGIVLRGGLVIGSLFGSICENQPFRLETPIFKRLTFQSLFQLKTVSPDVEYTFP